MNCPVLTGYARFVCLNQRRGVKLYQDYASERLPLNIPIMAMAKEASANEKAHCVVVRLQANSASIFQKISFGYQLFHKVSAEDKVKLLL